MTKSIEKNNLVGLLLGRNKQFSKQFGANPLVMLAAGEIVQDRCAREVLLDAIQVLSNYFQKCVMVRHVFCEDKELLQVTAEHLVEEFGHDLELNRDRNKRAAVWDPILEACSAWFSWKMITLDNDEKTVLMHLVLETSAVIFFKVAYKTMSKYGETNYFEKHASVDEQHEKMGLETIGDFAGNKEKLFSIQQQGWEMMESIGNQIVKIVLTRVGRSNVSYLRH